MKRRITVIFVFVFIFFTLAFASSSFFCVKSIDVVNLKLEEFSTSFVVNNNLIGKSIFLVNKTSCAEHFEQNNPYAKVVSTALIFPNSIQLNVVKRQAMFYIADGTNYFLLDRDFKILEKTTNKNKINKLCEISGKFENLSLKPQNFFEFFEFSSSAYQEGDFICKTNKIIFEIKNFVDIFEKNFEKDFFITEIYFLETQNSVSLVIKTDDTFGVELKIENILNNFDKKLNKMFCALKTLQNKDKIKTTYGELIIDDDFNCKWNNV